MLIDMWNRINFLKWFTLVFCSFLGVFLGFAIAPSKPLLPFLPSEYQYELMQYIELQIFMTCGFVVAVVALLLGLIMRVRLTASFLSIIFVGLTFGFWDVFRHGDIQEASILPFCAFIFGSFAFYGFFSISKKIMQNNVVK